MKTTAIFIFFLLGVVMANYSHNLHTKNDSKGIVIDAHAVNLKSNLTKFNVTSNENNKTMETIENFLPRPKTLIESFFDLFDDLLIKVLLTYISLVATIAVGIIYRRER